MNAPNTQPTITVGGFSIDILVQGFPGKTVCHGGLGWTLACGSGSLLADLISGRRLEVDFPLT